MRRAACLFFTLVACSRAPAAEPESMSEQERLDSASVVAETPTCTLPGVYDAQRRHSIRARTEGRLELLDIHEGQHLAAHTSAARIVDERTTVAIAETQAAVRTLEVEGEIAQLEAAHASEQVELLRGMQDYVAREELRAAERKLETSRLGVRRSRSQLQRGEAEHASAKQRGAMGELVVEFDAVVVALTAEQGQWVAAGQDVLIVADQQPRRVNLLVDPKAASRINVGDRVEVERLDGLTGERAALPIVRIGAAVLDDTGLVEVSLDASELDGARLGEAVRVFAPWHEDIWCTGT